MTTIAAPNTENINSSVKEDKLWLMDIHDLSHFNLFIAAKKMAYDAWAYTDVVIFFTANGILQLQFKTFF